MNNNKLLIFIFIAGSVWDVTTSFLGIVGILGVTDFKWESLGTYITALVGSIIMLGLSLNTESIYAPGADQNYKIIRPFHITSIFFDAYTSYLGTAQNILLRDSRTAFITIGFGEVWEKTTFEQKFILLFLTIAVTISPIMVSKLNRGFGPPPPPTSPRSSKRHYNP
jgi:hypothetical protein